MHWKCIGCDWTESPEPGYSSIMFPFSLFEGFRWCSRYSCTISSVTFPVDQPPYPIAQKCRPQYLFFKPGNSCWRIREVRPFIRFTKSLIDNFGGYSICTWIWSLLTTPFRICTSSVSHICIIRSRHLSWMSPFNTGYRYFVTQTKCAVNRVTVWLLRLCSFIESRLACV